MILMNTNLSLFLSFQTHTKNAVFQLFKVIQTIGKKMKYSIVGFFL